MDKVAVPIFIADWLKKCQHNNHTLYGVFMYATGEVEDWLFNTGDKKDKANLIARAWLDGFEIEEEDK